jgi:hypothetical protein
MVVWLYYYTDWLLSELTTGLCWHVVLPPLCYQVFSRRSSTSSTSSNDSGTPIDLLDEPSLPFGASAGLFYANGATGYQVKLEICILGSFVSVGGDCNSLLLATDFCCHTKH